MKIEINWFKVLWKRLWGGREAVFEYFLDIGNTLYSGLDGATKDKCHNILASAELVRDSIERLGWLCPKSWKKYYDAVLAAFGAVLDALEDEKVTPEELNALVIAFQSAYAVWKADDVSAEEVSADGAAGCEGCGGEACADCPERAGKGAE